MKHVMTEPGADPIIVEGHFPVGPERVFKAWTDPDEVQMWFGAGPGALANATIDLREGGRWCFLEDASQGTGFEGEYLEVVHDERLVFSWSRFTTDRSTGRRRTTPVSRVEIQLTPTARGTNMRIEHSSLDAVSRIEFRVGWGIGTTKLASWLAVDAAQISDHARPAER